MRTIQNLRIPLILTLILLTSLGCGLISQVTDPVGEFMDEAQQIITQVGDMATQANVEELSATLEAMTTAMPVDLEGLQATAEAVTESLQPGEAPPDIPLVDETTNLFTSKDLVSYTTALGYRQVIDFYKEQMPLNEWIALEDDNIETPAAAILNFEKPNRKAVVTISSNPLNAETVVLISITVP
ncbi:MAG: hypothetical protein JW862_09390 [Anaerolineales bacterium]|nr:hypothetical protein [Anaerolineales bacterium]